MHLRINSRCKRQMTFSGPIRVKIAAGETLLAFLHDGSKCKKQTDLTFVWGFVTELAAKNEMLQFDWIKRTVLHANFLMN